MSLLFLFLCAKNVNRCHEMPDRALGCECTSTSILCDVTLLNSVTIEAKSEHFPNDF